MADTLQQLVRDALKEMGSAVDDAEALDMNKSLLADYGLTSNSVIRLVMAIEIEFNVQLNDEDLNMDNFESIATIQELLETEYMA